MNVSEALARGAQILPLREGIPDPRREARWLLARSWGVDEVWLRLRPEAEMPPEVDRRYHRWLELRAGGVPAHHLTGQCDFWGRQLLVSASVLIPRPETELLVGVVLELPLARKARVLDVGTGSGCIAVTLGAERPAWKVVAVDTSLAALAVARTNAARHGVDLGLCCGDLAAACAPPCDLVVANLPYIPSATLARLSVEVRHDPRSALDGGRDGLDLVRRLLADVPRLLRPCGGVVLEIGEGQAGAVSSAAADLGLGVARRVADVGGCERVMVLQRR